jgi:predicted alpha/beta hydrolase family esterase
MLAEGQPFAARPARVDDEQIGVALVLKRVEQDLDDVIAGVLLVAPGGPSRKPSSFPSKSVWISPGSRLFSKSLTNILILP